jgi:NTE family protein
LEPFVTGKKKIAIACQGGGSQTAFTAGVLAHLLREGVQEEFEIVSLSGASGGAICAALAWCGLQLREPEPWARLEAFWADNTAKWPSEQIFNDALLGMLRLASRGNIPVMNTTPYSPGIRAAMAAFSPGLRPEYADFGTLLRKHLDIEAMAAIPLEASPVLLVGAVDILSGRMREFTSRDSPIRAEHLMASAAVPGLFQAVDVGDGGMYWDGLFSDNPPVGELVRAEIVGARKTSPTRSGW